ncbi:hypothetical protein EDB81DRAFT_653955 [Dactylonectria macrodidyma]|uniref:C2H2-type domain-containing protein n=1 Tax=Dactylonectria macrodidyma TaxID=307937 RepID=A0A9P9IZG6_9HYPO|nr:hypothetical protein EDB81DRAFT_653955 [Dactylonectria macrodidyma]
MWLVDIFTLRLQRYNRATNDTPYATLSYCWEDGGVNFTDLNSSDAHSLTAVSHGAGLENILKACSEAQAFGVTKLWASFLCVDRSSSADLSEALNSMFEIYQNAQVCLAHLRDLHSDPGKYIAQSKWRRGVWMLPELIASKDIQFYDRQWNQIGSKKSLVPFLSRLLRIDRAVLEDSESLPDFSIGQRMSWAAQLLADRPEDVAYSLLGIFGVSMTIIYGEGQQAFLRLQEEMLKDTDDATLFGWQSTSGQQYRGLFANSPSEFTHFGNHSPSTPLRIRGYIQTSSAGILIVGTFGPKNADQEILLCLVGWNSEDDGRIGLGIPLRAWNNRYVRSSPSLALNLSELPEGRPRRICITRSVTARTSSAIVAGYSPASKLSIDPSRYNLSQDIKSESVAAPTPTRESSVFLGATVPLRPFHGGQIRDQRDTNKGRAETIGDDERQGSVKLLENPVGDTSDSPKSSELEGQGIELHRSRPGEYPPRDYNHKIQTHAFACPFERRTPERYKSCLKEGGFPKICDLIRHLEKAHPLPYYCPKCSQIFDTPGACDGHIRKHTCDLRAEVGYEGISEHQMRQLATRLIPLQSKEERWYAIWRCLFGGPEKPSVPFVSSKVEACIRWLREYWLNNGKDVVFEFLESKGCRADGAHWTETDMTLASRKVLDRMIDKLLELSIEGKDGQQDFGKYRGIWDVLQRILS